MPWVVEYKMPDRPWDTAFSGDETEAFNAYKLLLAEEREARVGMSAILWPPTRSGAGVRHFGPAAKRKPQHFRVGQEDFRNAVNEWQPEDGSESDVAGHGSKG